MFKKMANKLILILILEVYSRRSTSFFSFSTVYSNKPCRPISILISNRAGQSTFCIKQCRPISILISNCSRQSGFRLKPRRPINSDQSIRPIISNRPLILRARFHFILGVSQLVLLCPSFLLSKSRK